MCDQFLRSHVDLKFDVVRLGRIDAERAVKILPKQIAGGAGRVFRRVEIMLHEGKLSRTKVAKCTAETARVTSKFKMAIGPRTFIRTRAGS
jgi:hypothetical protein